MRLAKLLGASLAVAVLCALCLHLSALWLSPEFFRDYLLPFAEGPALARSSPVALASYLALLGAWKPGLAGGLLAWIFSSAGGRPPAPLRRGLGAVAASGVWVLGWCGWQVWAGRGAGASDLSLAGDLLGAARIPTLVAFAVGSVGLYLGRRFTAMNPGPPESPAEPPAPES